MDLNLGIYLTNLLWIAGFVSIFWIISLILKDSSIADIAWGLIFTLAAWSTFFQVEGVLSRKILLATLVTLWGVRLALHIGIRNHGAGEDPRYQAFRRNWGDKYWIGSLLQVFLLQGFLGWVISLSVQAGIQSTTPANLTWVAWVGLAIWIFGFLFETIGDWQLTRFKANPDNKGKVMEFGLWRYTRHPNYFGEAVMWWGIFVIVLENVLNAWTVISPLLITYLLLKVSGVSMLERTVVKTRPKYAEYQRKTNAFIPWFPKE
mgnify:CR=1 FL=1